MKKLAFLVQELSSVQGLLFVLSWNGNTEADKVCTVNDAPTGSLALSVYEKALHVLAKTESRDGSSLSCLAIVQAGDMHDFPRLLGN